MPARIIPLVTDWTITLHELVEGRRAISYDVLALALRGPSPVPTEVREFLASMIETGQLKKALGRPHKGNWLERQIEHDLIVDTYRLCLWRAQQTGKSVMGTPSERALHMAATQLRNEGIQITTENLKKQLRKPHWSKPWPKKEDPFDDKARPRTRR